MRRYKDRSTGLILCARKDDPVARYALEGLPNKVMASEYRTALPGVKELAAEIGRTQVLLERTRTPVRAERYRLWMDTYKDILAGGRARRRIST